MKNNTLIVILHSNEKERINYALSIIASGAAIGRKTELFFTGKSVTNLLKSALLKKKKLNSQFNFSNSNELLLASIELKTIFHACSGALSENKINKNDIRKDLNINLTGLPEIISNKNSQLLFI